MLVQKVYNHGTVQPPPFWGWIAKKKKKSVVWFCFVKSCRFWVWNFEGRKKKNYSGIHILTGTFGFFKIKVWISLYASIWEAIVYIIVWGQMMPLVCRLLCTFGVKSLEALRTITGLRVSGDMIIFGLTELVFIWLWSGAVVCSWLCSSCSLAVRIVLLILPVGMLVWFVCRIVI